MTVAAQGGVVGFGIQSAKVGAGGTFTPADLSYYRIRAPRVNMGSVQDVQTMPLELGGALTPTGAYKQQYFFAGDMDLIPRLKTFGILALAALGKVTTSTGQDFDGANVGVNKHVFAYDATNPAYQPWMSFRRMVPGALASENSGETGFDCKVNAMRLTIPAMGKLAVRASVVGRDFVLDDASTWVWINTYEDATLSPESGRGSFSIGGTEYPITALVIEIANNLSTPRDEMIVGDFRPDDFIALSRGVSIRATVKYANDDMYRQILTGQVDGTVWTSLPFTTSGATALVGTFEAPLAISGAAHAQNYAMRIQAAKVVWEVDGPPQLVGGGIVQLNLSGTVLEPDSGDYFSITLLNDAAGSMYATANPAQADVEMEFGASDTTPAAESQVTLTAVIHNHGPDAATNVLASIVLPEGLTYVSDTGAGAYVSATGVWTVAAPIAVDGDATLQVVATVDAGTPSSTVIPVTAQITSLTETDPYPLYNSVTLNLVVS